MIKKSGKIEKIQKNTELVSIMASQMLEMKSGERTRITPFAKSIILSNSSHPHFDSVEKKLTEAMLWKDVTPLFNFYTKEGRLEEIEKIKEEKQKFLTSPRDIKSILAREVVKIYHGEKEALKAEEEFNKIFRDKQTPSEIEIFETDKKIYSILGLLCDTKLAPSKNEAKRLINAGSTAVITDGKEEIITDWKKEIYIKDKEIIRVGKRRFIKIKIKNS